MTTSRRLLALLGIAVAAVLSQSAVAETSQGPTDAEYFARLGAAFERAQDRQVEVDQIQAQLDQSDLHGNLFRFTLARRIERETSIAEELVYNLGLVQPPKGLRDEHQFLYDTWNNQWFELEKQLLDLLEAPNPLMRDLSSADDFLLPLRDACAGLQDEANSRNVDIRLRCGFSYFLDLFTSNYAYPY